MRQPPFALRTHRLTARSVSTARNVFRTDLKTYICSSVIERGQDLYFTLSVTLSRRTYGTIRSRKTNTSPHRRFLLLCMCEPHWLLQEERKEDSDEPAPCGDSHPSEL
jgi:hypothetical protein